ncbi:phytanoyl-CoA dioxygenase family protein [Actinopolymorpha sp. B17G11]|uniref:phytanoyl-CoA dioxygenase family protein n=1 Tax=unclassified Actinopolymorpha TaxID=2627063 RepID=UPI0032D909C5
MTTAAASFDKGIVGDTDVLYRTPGVAEPLDDLQAVSSAAIEHYRAEGFLAIRSGVTPSAVADLMAGLASLARPDSPADIQYEKWAEDRFDQLSPDERLDATRKYMSFARHDARLEAVAHDPGIMRVVTMLLGGEPRLFQEMALIKPPGGGREKPWHQDNAYFHLVPGTPIVGVWIALDEATLDNGCMRVIPGSHREGPVRHAFLRDLQICDGEVPIDRGVAVPLPPGGLLLFDGLLQHGTPTNFTRTRRRALQFHYTVDSAVSTSDDEHRATFGWVDGAEC